MANLSFLYINGGFKVLYTVALMEILRVTYGLNPDELQVAEAFMLFPWDFKILYGIICDTLSLPRFEKAPKRGYIILFSIIQFVCLFLSGAFVFEKSVTLINMFFISSLSGAFMDVVIDGITCAQQRRDPERGAQDLQTLAWFSQSVGAISASIIGGYIVDYSEARYCFYLYAMISLGVAITAYWMSQDLEETSH